MSDHQRKRVNKLWLNPSFDSSLVSCQTLKRFKEISAHANERTTETELLPSSDFAECSTASEERYSPENDILVEISHMPETLTDPLPKINLESSEISTEYQRLNTKLKNYAANNITIDEIFTEDITSASSSDSSSECDDDMTNIDEIFEASEIDDYPNLSCENEAEDVLPKIFDTSSMQGSMMMFPESGLLVSDVLLMTNIFATTKNFSERDENDLLNLIKTLAGPRFKNWNPSLYLRSKTYNPPSDKIQTHFYCEICNVIIGKRELKDNAKKEQIICPTCNNKYELSSSAPNHFLTIDIEYQLQMLLNEPNLQRALLNNLSKIKSCSQSDCITDVYDSELYKELQLKLPGTLTFNFNTDGAPVFRHSKLSFWPIQLIINELPPQLRFCHRILAGLFVTQTEPKPEFMNLYLTALCVQIQHLQEKGVKIFNHLIGAFMTLKFYLFAGCVDSVARPVLQNRLQYNGYWGCSWCYIHGKYVANCIHYVMTEEDSELRTHYLHVVQARQASKLNASKPVSKKAVTIFGIKGISAFINELIYFDNVWGYPFDRQHGKALGQARQLWYKWISPNTPQKYRLTSQDIIKIDQRLASITPTHEIPRLPLPASQFKHWKANQCEAWLTFWCIPCLDGILHEDLFKSLALLVQSSFTLSKSAITTLELLETDYNLLKFCGESQVYYGENSMTFNIHSTLHECESVKKTGPQWASSTYPFEDGIGKCKTEVNGPRGVAQQVAKKTLKKLLLRTSIDRSTHSDTCAIFCHSLFSYNRVANSTKLQDNVLLIGEGKKNAEIESAMKEYLNNPDIVAYVFDRCIYHHSVLHSDEYNRVRRTNDSVVSLKSKKVIIIKKFVSINDICYIYGHELKYSIANFSHGVQVNHIYEVINSVNKSVVIDEITSISEKVMKLQIQEKQLLVYLPNNYILH